MSSNNPYSEITQEILDLSELCRKGSAIDPALYEKLDVKRGLRDINGKGVLAGLTEISEIQSSMVDERGTTLTCEGKSCYHGINI